MKRMTKTLTLGTALIGLALSALTVRTAAAEPVEPACRERGPVLSAVHRLPDAVVAASDPDWLTVVESRARDAVRSGEWAQRVKDQELTLRRWATDPRLPPSPPPARRTTLSVKPTGFALSGQETPAVSVTVNGATRVLPTSFPAEPLISFSRVWLFLDATRPTEVAFAQALEKAMTEASGLPSAMRVVLTGGSVRDMSGRLTSRVYADQGAAMTRRLGLKASPALVRLTAEAVTVFTPALNAEGLCDEPVPVAVTGLTHALTLDTRRAVRMRTSIPDKKEETRRE